jgi:hypothetical protein
MSDPAELFYERLLVLRCQTGDEAALGELIGRFTPRLAYFVHKLAADAHRTDDILQETWIDVVRQLPKHQDTAAFAAWFLRLTPSATPTNVDLQRILEDDRRRTRRLGRLVVALWIAAALGALLVLIIGGFVFPMIAKLTGQENGGAGDPALAPLVILTKFTAINVVVGSASFVALVVAGLATVPLVFRTRAATLRQINANLMEISAQLKLLKT